MSVIRRRLSLCIVTLLTACAAPELEQSRTLWAHGQYEEAVKRLETGSKQRPQDIELRANYLRQRDTAVGQFVAQAETARLAQQLDDAEELYRRALRLEPESRRANDGLTRVATARRLEQAVTAARAAFDAGQLADADARSRAVLTEDPRNSGARRVQQSVRERQAQTARAPGLKSAFGGPVTLELRDTPLRNVFELLSRNGQINFVIDKEVRADTRVTIYVRNSPLEDVLRLLLATNQLEHRVLNENSVLVYPATQVKQREYQELAVRLFFLTNIEAKQAQGLLRAMTKSKDIYIDEKMNLLSVRDTPEAVRLAERLMEAIDVAEPEVMLEVEVLEIGRSRAIDLGLNFPTEILGESRLPGSDRVASGRIDLGRSHLLATIAAPAVRLGLLSQDTDSNLLANPRIRVKNREKAKILIGEKLPVFTSTATAGTGGFLTSSVSYLDVGLKLEVEANVFLDDEVGIKVSLEVNSNLGAVSSGDASSGASTAYRIGTRTAQTALRLRDGETQVLAGLINDNERETLSKLPGFGDIPGVGRLFSNTNRTRDKTEIVLLITPRVLRNMVAPDFDAVMLASGTEAATGARPLTIASTTPRGLALQMDDGRGGGAPAAPGRTQPPRSAPAEGAERPAEAAPPAPTAIEITLRAPAEAAIGRDFVATLDVTGAGAAAQGEVALAFDASLLQAPGASGGRTVVRLAGSGNTLSGSVTFRVLAAGAGSASVQVLDGIVRLQDGSTRPVPGGANATVRIGL